MSAVTLTPVAVAVALAACGQPASLHEPHVQAAPFCFAVVAEREGQSHYSVACLDEMPLCLFARERAIAVAGLARFTVIGDCRYTEAMR
jgi:hypothetical protein